MLITSVFDTSSALFDAARSLFQSTAQCTANTPHALLLPGGTTPRPLFDSIRETPFPVSANFRVGYTDERHVPPNSPESNSALSRDMLHALGITGNQILSVNTDQSLEAAADDYDSTWREFLEQDGAIPLAFLGLGTDGHTCSLFTEEQIRACPPERYAVAVPRDDGPDRVSVTPALLIHVSHIVLLATGQQKAAVVDAMTHEPDKVPAGMALSQCSRVSLWYAPQD